MYNKAFGEKIARLRKAQRLTQAQLAEKLHISNKTISRWETGEGYPDITLLAPLAQALDTTTDELLKETSKKNASKDEEAPRETIKEKHRMRPIAFWKHLTIFNKVGMITIGLAILSISFNFIVMLLNSSGEHNMEFAVTFVPLCALLCTTVPKAGGVVTALGILLGLTNLYEKQYKTGTILTIINFCLPYLLLLPMYAVM